MYNYKLKQYKQSHNDNDKILISILQVLIELYLLLIFS